MTPRDPWAPVPASGEPERSDLPAPDSVTNDLADLFAVEDAAPADISSEPDEVGGVVEHDALADLFAPNEPASPPAETKRTRPGITLGSVPSRGKNRSPEGTPVQDIQPVPAQMAPASTPMPVMPPQELSVPATQLAKSGSGSLDKRYTDAERLWPIVDQVMAVAGAEARIQSRVAGLELTREAALDSQQREELFAVLKPLLASHGIRIPDPTDVPPVLQMAYDELIGISVLGELWRDDSVTEILVDRWDRITAERGGRLEPTRISFRTPDHAASVARSLALRVSQRQVSRSLNLVTAELPRARVQFAYGPVVRGGLAIAIRKFSALLGLQALRDRGTLDEQMEFFLRDAVQARAGVLVSGGTGTGKTTIINLLSSFIPDSERVVTIEDAFELSLANTHVVSLQTKEASSADDAVSVTLSQLLRATLRLRPDRIIVGEIREGEGAEVMLAASNTGHDGTMTTIHANSADMAVNERLVDLVRQNRNSSDDAIRRTIASAFDIVVQVDRGRGGRRFISSISQIDRSMLVNGQIEPRVIFIGEEDGVSPQPIFRRLSGVRPDTALGRRLIEAGSESWIER